MIGVKGIKEFTQISLLLTLLLKFESKNLFTHTQEFYTLEFEKNKKGAKDRPNFWEKCTLHHTASIAKIPSILYDN